MRLEARFATLLVLGGLVLTGCGPLRNPPENQAPENQAPNYPDTDIPSPEKYRVKLETSEGNVIIEVTRDWSPKGADRFYTLVKNQYYDDCRFFRVMPGFMAQVGMNGNPQLTAEWKKKNISDDPVKESNIRGTVTFANSGPHSRSTQFFINFGNSSFLDKKGFSPFGRVVEGMDHVDSIYPGYGEKPNQGQITKLGNKYLNENFPQLDYIIKATIVSEDNKEVSAKTESKK